MMRCLRFQLPNWIPYRLRCRWDQWRIDSSLRGVLKTPPREAALPDAALAEVQMLLCRRDLLPGILALKSILTETSLPLSVTITSDGSLSAADKELVDQQIAGVRWLDWPSEDASMLTQLLPFPRLARLYLGPFHFSSKLLHPIIGAEHERVILLDSDTVFWSQPDDLCAWIRGGIPECLYLQDSPRRIPSIPFGARQAFEEFVATLPPDKRQWHVDNLFFNAGLLAFHRSAMDLTVVEKYLAWHEQNAAKISFPLSDIWFGAWTLEQTSWLIMFATQSIPSLPFNGNYSLGCDVNHAFNHFLRSGLTQERTLMALRTKIESETSVASNSIK